TMLKQREIIEAIKQANLRDKVKVIVGGAPTTEDWAKEIGADGWAPDAASAVELVKKLLK
ncbi:MAG: cobalamin-binding protein, partial [archaeon GBS-70-058]|nr:cobalamin-binding protein [Candidatus Culexarchaeum nevadense]